jgi:phenolic acid decarboxylase
LIKFVNTLHPSYSEQVGAAKTVQYKRDEVYIKIIDFFIKSFIKIHPRITGCYENTLLISFVPFFRNLCMKRKKKEKLEYVS